MFEYIARAHVNEPHGLNGKMNTCRENTRIGTVVTRMHSIINRSASTSSFSSNSSSSSETDWRCCVGSYRFVDLVCGKAAADQKAGRFASNLSHRIVILC